METDTQTEQQKESIYKLPTNTDGDIVLTVSEMFNFLHQELQKARGDWFIGRRIKVYNDDHVVVGTSTMVYDKDCEGEPEWKITDQIQEVAIAKYYSDISYQKPCWLKVTALQSELDQRNIANVSVSSGTNGNNITTLNGLPHTLTSSELDQPTDGMPHPFGNPEGVYGSKSTNITSE